MESYRIFYTVESQLSECLIIQTPKLTAKPALIMPAAIVHKIGRQNIEHNVNIINTFYALIIRADILHDAKWTSVQTW